MFIQSQPNYLSEKKKLNSEKYINLIEIMFNQSNFN